MFFIGFNERTFRIFIHYFLHIENIVTFSGFSMAFIMALLNKTRLSATGGIISLIMPLYYGIQVNHFEIKSVILIIISIVVIDIGFF